VNTKTLDTTPEPIFDGKWELASLALRDNRIALVEDFNRLAGLPSYAMATFQREFIEECMEPSETIDFAKVCLGLMAAAIRTGKFPV
jgi:hypothetical protein